MRQRTLVLAFAILATAFAIAGDRNFSRLTLLSSSDARGKVTTEDLQRCYARLAHAWNIKEDRLPRVMVFHVNRDTAGGALVKKEVVIRRNLFEDSDRSYYEIWLVGDAHHKYVLALENVIEHHFDLKVSNEQRAEVVARVTRLEDATVSVTDLSGR